MLVGEMGCEVLSYAFELGFNFLQDIIVGGGYFENQGFIVC